MRTTTLAAAALAVALIAAPAALAESWPLEGHDAARTFRSTAVAAQSPRLVPGWPLVRAWGAPVWVDPAGNAVLNPWNDPRDGVLNANGTFRSLGGVAGVRAIGPDGRRYTADAETDRVSAWSPDGALLWTAASVDLGPAASERVLLPAPDGMLYAGGFQGWAAFAPDGRVAWTAPTNMSNRAAAIAVAPDGTVVLCLGGDTATPLLQRRRPDGTVLWSRPLTSAVERVAITGAGTVVTTQWPSSGAGGAGVRTYALADGAPGWSLDTGRAVPSAPALTAEGGVLTVVGRTLRALAPDGTPRWSLPGGHTGDILIGGDGTAYVGGAPLTAVRPDGSVLWRMPYGGRVTPWSIGGDGTLYAGGAETAFAFAPPGTRGVAIPAAPARPLVSGANLSTRTYRVRGASPVCAPSTGACRPTTALGARLGMRLSREATVTVEVRRTGVAGVWARSQAYRLPRGTNWVSMLDVSRRVGRGTATRAVPLAPGRYTVTVRAAAGRARISTRPLSFRVAATALPVVG